MSKTILVSQPPFEKNSFHVIKNNSWSANSSSSDGKIVSLAINDDNRFHSSRDAENVLMKLEFCLQLDSLIQHQKQQLRCAR